MACGFGLYRPDRLAVNEERLVRFAGLESELAHRDAAGRGEVHRAFVLHVPAALIERLVDLFAGYFLGVWHSLVYSTLPGP